MQLQLLADGCLEAGRIDLGLGAVRETMALMEASDVRIDEALIYRLEGELLLRRGEDGDVDEAEVCFLKAIEVARRQEAKLWELRAATSLARLWQRQGKPGEAGRHSLQLVHRGIRHPRPRGGQQAAGRTVTIHNAGVPARLLKTASRQDPPGKR